MFFCNQRTLCLGVHSWVVWFFLNRLMYILLFGNRLDLCLWDPSCYQYSFNYFRITRIQF